MPEREHFTNFRCSLFGTGLAIMATAFGAQVSGWKHWITIGLGYGIGIALMLIAIVLIARSSLTRNSEVPTSQTAGIVPGIPTLSGLLGQNSPVEFNAKQYFATAYYSPLTAEVEKNIRIVAQQYSPQDKEAFYARLIGVGWVSLQHEATWLIIFGSQLAALAELNSRGLIPLADVKKHYDKAATDFPKTYENYSFVQWLNYLKSRLLIAIYPTQMAELSFNGKDFLKYLAHAGYNANSRKS